MVFLKKKTAFCDDFPCKRNSRKVLCPPENFYGETESPVWMIQLFFFPVQRFNFPIFLSARRRTSSKTQILFFRNLGTTPTLKKKQKRSRSEKAILGATLGILGNARSNSRNDTHDLVTSCVTTLFSEQISEWLWDLVGHQNFSPNSRCTLFQDWGGPRAQEICVWI